MCFLKIFISKFNMKDISVLCCYIFLVYCSRSMGRNAFCDVYFVCWGWKGYIFFWGRIEIYKFISANCEFSYTLWYKCIFNCHTSCNVIPGYSRIYLIFWCILFKFCREIDNWLFNVLYITGSFYCINKRIGLICCQLKISQLHRKSHRVGVMVVDQY